MFLGLLIFKKKINSNQTINNQKILKINDILIRNKVKKEHSNKHGSIDQDKLKSQYNISCWRSLYYSKKIYPFLLLISDFKNTRKPAKRALLTKII